MADSSKKLRHGRASSPNDAGGGRDPDRGPLPPVVREAAKDGAGSFDFSDLTRSHQESLQRAKKQQSRLSPLVVAGGVMLFCAVAGGGIMFWLGRKEPLVLKPINEQFVDELDTLEFTVAVQEADGKAGRLEYTLEDGPEGARIDRETGKFSWCPTERQGPGHYRMTVRVVSSGRGGRPAEKRFGVQVREVKRPPVLARIEEKTVEVGGRLEFQVRAEGAVGEGPEGAIDQFMGELGERGAKVGVADGEFSHPSLLGKLRLLSVDGQRVGVFGYGTAEAAARDAAGLTPEDLQQYAKSLAGQSSAYLFQHERLIAFYVGGDGALLKLLDGRLGRPVVVKTIDTAPPAGETTFPSVGHEAAPPNGRAAEASDGAEGDEIILQLYEKNKLLSKREYRTLRKVFAERFENGHREQIREKLGEKNGEMRQWLEEHVDIKQELYLAIDPEHDKVPEVLGLFKELKEGFPGKIESYASLAIAVSVVWDDQRRAIHRSPCGQHQSVRPEGEVGAVENFRYFVETEGVMQGRAAWLPWEFLVQMVNHRTPLEERGWALNFYLPKRVKFGKCYGDVPYDGKMLKGADPKLKGQPHTLPNLVQYGGVCTARADFAARVGKSIGVPALSVGGKSRYGEGHAWVMWVELGRVTRTGFTFSLESHGRFRGDRYYVGNLNDPHTGQPTTDRELELRLHTVGIDPIAKRQADLVMRSYAMLRERAELDTADQLLFLSRVIDLSPGNEEAWKALAKMSRDGQITKTNSKPMVTVLNRLFTVFTSLPDFTWVVFDDLVSFQDIPKRRAELFGRLAALYERAKRPDLSCKARLKYAEYLVADKRVDEAIQGLTVAILLFPEEGNFVPKMLDKLEELCRQQEGSQRHLAGFYQEFLPKIPRYRSERPSSYCMQMYKRGIQRFREAGMEQLAQAYRVQLGLLEANRGGKR